MSENSQRINRRLFFKRTGALGLGVLVSGAPAAGSDRFFVRTRATLPAYPPNPEPISFGLITDTHFGDLDDTNRPRYFRSSLGNTAETVQYFNQQGLGFVVHLGDVVQESKNRATTLGWLREMDEAVAGFNGPIHYVMGNHDLGDLGKAEFLSATSGTFKAPHYYFDRSGYRFIVLDPNFTKEGVPYNRGNFSWTDSAIPPSQVAWLEKALEGAKHAGMPAIIFSHQCFDETSANHKIANAAELRELFEQMGNVIAVFYGHRHAGGYYKINDIHYIGLVATVNGSDSAAVVVRLPGSGYIEVEGLGARQPSWGPLGLPA